MEKYTALKNEAASHWRARAEIDLSSLQFNIAQIRSTAPTSKILAVVKADAYGHGLENIAGSIADLVDGFAVATVQEGIECRKLQQDKPVVVLSEFWHADQLQYFEKYQLDVVIHNELQLEWMERYRGCALSVWVKFDTGMNRLGIHVTDVANYVDRLDKMQSVATVRMLSHLANADLVDDEYTLIQRQRFEEVQKPLQLESSLANTAGVMRWPQTHYNWVRPGIMLYGVSPYQQSAESEIELKPVMTLKARILALKSVPRGAPVGYGGRYITSRKSRLAMVGLGYGDGYPRQLDDRACVLIRANRVPITGKISMDMITVDVTNLEGVVAGEEVVLWGQQLGIEEVADWAGTIPYELLCKVTPRIPRVLL